jgi:hypothetical protein
VGFVSV